VEGESQQPLLKACVRLAVLNIQHFRGFRSAIADHHDTAILLGDEEPAGFVRRFFHADGLFEGDAGEGLIQSDDGQELRRGWNSNQAQQIKGSQNDLIRNVLGFWDTLKRRLTGILGEQEECQRF